MKPLLFSIIAITALTGCAPRIDTTDTVTAKTLDTVNFNDYRDLTELYDDLQVPLRWKVRFHHGLVDRTVRKPRIIAERYCESQYGTLVRVARQREILNFPSYHYDEDYHQAVHERVQTSFGYFDCMSLMGHAFWRVTITHGEDFIGVGTQGTTLHIDVYDLVETRAMREKELAAYDQTDRTL